MTVATSLANLESWTHLLTPTTHQKIVQTIIESQSTISRDVFRLVNVVCELIRGTRTTTFEECVQCLQSHDFLDKLFKLKSQSVTNVSRDANAAVLRKVDTAALPDIMRPLYRFVAACLGMNKDVKAAQQYIQNEPGYR